MATYRGMGRLWFRPKNTKSAPPGFALRLIAGVIAFTHPAPLEAYEGISGVENLPTEEMVEVEVTVRVVGRWRRDERAETSDVMLNRCRIDQILTSPAYAHPEDFGMVLVEEAK